MKLVIKTFMFLFLFETVLAEESLGPKETTEGKGHPCLHCLIPASGASTGVEEILEKVQTGGYIGPKNRKLIKKTLTETNYDLNIKVCNQNGEIYFTVIEGRVINIFDLKKDVHKIREIEENITEVSFSEDCESLFVLEDPYYEGEAKLHEVKIGNEKTKNVIGLGEVDIVEESLSIGSDGAVSFQTKRYLGNNKYEYKLLSYKDGKRIYEKVTAGRLKSTDAGYLLAYKDTMYGDPNEKQIIYSYKNGDLKEIKGISADRRYRYSEISETKNNRLLVRQPNQSGLYKEILVYDKKTGKLKDTFLGHQIKVDENGDILYLKPIAVREHDLYKYNTKTGEHQAVSKTKVGDIKSYAYDRGVLFSSNNEITKTSLQSNASETASGELASKEVEVTHEEQSAYSYKRGFAHNEKKDLKMPYRIIKKRGIKSKGIIIYAHGGAPNFSGDYTGGSIQKLLDPFLEEGYAIVGISHHGSSILSLGNYMNLEPNDERHPKDYFKDESDDFLAIDSAMKKKAKGKPVIWFGHSNGSGTLNAYLTQKKEKVNADCAISFAGMWDYRINSKSKNLEDYVYYVNQYQTSPQASIHDNNYGNTRLSKYADPVQQPNYEAAKKRLKEHLKAGNGEALVFFKSSEPEYSTRNPVEHLKDISIPVFAFNGGKDGIITPEEIKVLSKQVKKEGIQNISTKIYSGAGHSPGPGDTGYDEIVKDMRSFINNKCHNK